MIELIDIQHETTISDRMSLTMESACLNRKVKLDIIGYKPVVGKIPCLLLLNDGQDIDSLGIPSFLAKRQQHKAYHPVLVAIHAKNRKSEYGISGHPDYCGRGDKAGKYEDFVVNELFPVIRELTGIDFKSEHTYFAGFSLGGISAIDIALSNPQLFNGAGVFSGSFWWRSKAIGNGYMEDDRIFFQKYKSLQLKNHFKIWLMAGTDDERVDRNFNGVIDAVDDTLDIYDFLNDRASNHTTQIKLEIVNGGKHHASSWEKIFPEFIEFAFESPFSEY